MEADTESSSTEEPQSAKGKTTEQQITARFNQLGDDFIAKLVQEIQVKIKEEGTRLAEIA